MERSVPSLKETFVVWLKIGAMGFGGQAGQLAIMHRLIVEEKQWISERHFLQVFNFCQILPGPAPQKLAIYIGWLLHQFRGGIAAGSLYILPGFLSVLTLSILYTQYYHLGLIQGLFYGLKPAVVAIILEAVIRMSQKTLKDSVMVTVCVMSFAAILFFHVSVLSVLFVAALAGFIREKIWPQPLTTAPPPPSKIRFSKTLKVAGICILLWLMPAGLLALFFGFANIYAKEGIFFSKVALTTFGGAYGAMPYIAQQAVGHYHWLTSAELLDGLGLIAVTPGPIVQVVQFIGFLAAYRHASGIPPLFAGFLGSLITVWSIFVPSFLWIFVSAPYIRKLRHNQVLTGTLSMVTAAVIGAILTVSMNFFINTVFKEVSALTYGPLYLPIPAWQSLDSGALFITCVALCINLRLKMGLFATLGVSIFLGMGIFFLR